MRVFFATNRNIEGNFENEGKQPAFRNPRFGIHPDEFRIGTAQVRIEKQTKVLGEPLNDRAVYKSARLAKERFNREKGIYTKRGSEEIFPQLLEAVHNNEGNKRNNRCSVLVFIHGYNNSFEESIITGAELAHLYSSDDHRLIPFVFSWPSDGEALNYQEDRRDAELSGGAGARLLACFLSYLKKLHGQGVTCLSSSYLITHSMGAYLLRYAVQNLQKTLCPVIPLFDATILMAPDVDADALESENKLLPINKLTQQVVVYTNMKDQLLNKAENFFSVKLRMGREGPGTNAFAKLEVPLTTVRCHNVDFDYDDNFGHRYYRRSITVIKDVKAVLSGKDPDEIDYREEVRPSGPGMNRYRLKPPEEYLNRPGVQPPLDEEED